MIDLRKLVVLDLRKLSAACTIEHLQKGYEEEGVYYECAAGYLARRGADKRPNATGATEALQAMGIPRRSTTPERGEYRPKGDVLQSVRYPQMR